MTIEELKEEKGLLEMDIGNLVQVEVTRFVAKTGIKIKSLTFDNYYTDASIKPVFMKANVELETGL